MPESEHPPNELEMELQRLEVMRVTLLETLAAVDKEIQVIVAFQKLTSEL
jgi:hypothetical protein